MFETRLSWILSIIFFSCFGLKGQELKPVKQSDLEDDSYNVSNAIQTGSAYDTIEYRNPYLWPFTKNSIWNTPLGSGAVYVHAHLKSASKGAWYDEDVIITTPDHPLTNIYKTDYKWGPDVNPDTRCIKSSNTVFFSWPIPSGYVTNFHASKANHGGAILMNDGRTLRFTQPFQVCEGGYATTYYTMSNTQDIITDNGIIGSHGGSGMSSIGGTIRLGELLPTTGPIRHALKVDLWGKYNMYWDVVTDGYRWPAIRSDGGAEENYGGTVKECRMGALLALPPDIDIENWGLSTVPGKKIAKAFQDFGGYIVDDAAQDVFTLVTEEGPGRNVAKEFEEVYGYPMKNNNLENAWVKDIIKIFTNLHVVDNNSAANTGGGGEPRAPGAPDFMPLYELSVQTDGTPDVKMNVSATVIVPQGQEIQLSINSIPRKYTFSHWEVVSGEAVITDSESPETTVLLAGDATIKAHFKLSSFSMNISITGNGRVSVDPEQELYTYSSEVTLTAQPDPGWEFDEWSGYKGSYLNPLFLTVYDEVNLNLNFVPDNTVDIQHLDAAHIQSKIFVFCTDGVTSIEVSFAEDNPGALIQVYDVGGRLVYNSPVFYEKQRIIHLEDLHQGMYLARLITEDINSLDYKKFIVV